ncbi:MAG: RNA processing protein [Phylliscum demangeonii]|nr:MAG: RNA processing protein [Phylliscum demangeonii]
MSTMNDGLFIAAIRLTGSSEPPGPAVAVAERRPGRGVRKKPSSGLLNAAQGHPMLVELKNGETLNGHLVSSDTYMNLILREVVQTSPDGDKFLRLPEVYVRGSNIKYLRVPDEIIELVKEQQQQSQHSARPGRGGNQARGDHAGRGDRGRGPGRGRGGRGRGR